MNRLTISLSETRYRALKEAAALRNSTMGALIDASLDFYGIKSREEAQHLIMRARTHSGLSEEHALTLAQAEVQAFRRGM